MCLLLRSAIERWLLVRLPTRSFGSAIEFSCNRRSTIKGRTKKEKPGLPAFWVGAVAQLLQGRAKAAQIMHNGKQKKRSRRGGGKAKQQQTQIQGKQASGASSSAAQSVLKPTQAPFHPKQPLPTHPPKPQAQQTLAMPSGQAKTDENAGFIDVFFEHNKPTHFLFFGQSAPFVFDRQHRSLENVPPPPPLPRAAR